MLPPASAPVDVDGGVKNPCEIEEVLEDEDACDVVTVPVFRTCGCVDVLELHADTASATATTTMAQHADRGIKDA